MYLSRFMHITIIIISCAAIHYYCIYYIALYVLNIGTKNITYFPAIPSQN